MRIAVMADIHLTNRTDTPQAAALKWAVDEISQSGADIAVIAGDLTASGDMEATLAVRKALDKLTVRYMAVPGNSDLRAPDMAEATARMFMPPPGGHIIGGVCVLGINASGNRISAEERARLCLADARAPLVIVSHQGPDCLDEDSRAFMAEWIRSRGRAGQQIRFWFYGHIHARAETTFEGVRCASVRALDADKCIGGPPEILIADVDTGEIESREFQSGLIMRWSREQREEFARELGITCYRFNEDMRFCIDQRVHHIELRGVGKDARALLSAWRRAGGRTLSIHLTSLSWDDAKGGIVGEAEFAQAVLAAIDMGADMATVHPPHEPMRIMRADGRAFDRLAARMAELLRPLRDAGIKITIENNHTRASDPPDALSRRYGVTPLELVNWMDEMNARLGDKACALRLDVGHARNNAPVSQFCPLGQWYSLIGARCAAYHLHQTILDENNAMRNHYPITGLDDGLVSFHGFMWAWHAGVLSHGPMILEIRENHGAPETYLRLKSILLGGEASEI